MASDVRIPALFPIDNLTWTAHKWAGMLVLGLGLDNVLKDTMQGLGLGLDQYAKVLGLGNE